jgi:predicted Ser/Thr protein kinase/tetratricopeptide (TPR) repeat protein
MKCPKCFSENATDSRFCRECGTQLFPGKEIPASQTMTMEIPKPGLKTGALFAGRYLILEELGKGGMGRVYRVKDQKLDEEMALKLLKPEIAEDEETIERFKNELKFARKISHRNVCRMYDLHEEKAIFFITMEYVSGVSLKSLIQRAGSLPAEKAIRIAEQICSGLEEAHKLGIIHRDLKPQNIMLDQDENAKIMDFGISRFLEAKGFTQTGMIIGTPDYLSPEQAEGFDVDLRSDIYSLGVILYEMVTGKVPFEGDTALSVVLKHKSELPRDPGEFNPRLSSELSAVILKCLAKDKEVRYQSAQELLQELDSLEKGTGVAASAAKPRVPAFLAEEEISKKEKPIFVAREQELKKLNTFLDKVRSGNGQVVFVTGEAGSGKTALIQEFCLKAQEICPDLIVANGKCNAHTGIGDPYLPFIELLALLTGDVEAKWAAGVMTKEHAHRLWNLIPQTGKAIVDHGPDLVNIFVQGGGLLSRAEAISSVSTDWLLGLKKLVERKSLLPPDSTLQQSNLFEQYTRVLVALAQEKPLLLVLDDLQWVDAGSASLLFHLGRRIAGSRILIVGAFRSDEVALGRGDVRHPLETVVHEFKRDFGDIELEVGEEEGQTFVDSLIDTEPNRLGQAFRETFFKQTKGHPLFTVELLREMQDRALLVKDDAGRWVEGPSLSWDTLPARVDAVIEERISRLSDNLREILTFASVEGEEFTAEVVAQLQELETRKLIRLLSNELDKRHHLVSAKGMRQLEKLHLSIYLFRHILYQRFLYNSLDEVERTHLHAEVGQILEDLYGERKEEISVQLARHFQEAGIVDKAIEYLHKAGNKAVRLSAGEEAIAHYKKALELLKALPETPQRAQQELALQLALAVPLQATKGFGAPELGQAVVRARELCQKIGETPQLFTALCQLTSYYATTAQYRTALKFLDQVTQIAEQSKDPMLEAISYYMNVWPLLNVGELVKTAECAEHMKAIYDPEKHGFMAYIFGYDLGVLNLAFGSWALWILGYPDQALKQTLEAMGIARKLGHPHTLAFILLSACELNWFLRDFEKINVYTEELVPLSEKNGLIYMGAHGYFYRGERQALEGKIKEGIKEMRRSLAIMEGTGTLTCFTRLMARVVDACRKAGAIEEGLVAVNEALGVVQKYDERYVEAELYRLKGELLGMRGEPENEVEKYFQQALEVSRRQLAKSWELRAAMSLARLMQKQGKQKEAYELLNGVFSWFTEGFDFPDLKDAKTLLEELR